MTRKQLNTFLISIGYHHSWGYFISNDNKMKRIVTWTSKGRKNTMLNFTDRGNYYDLTSNGNAKINLNVTNFTETDIINLVN